MNKRQSLIKISLILTGLTLIWGCSNDKAKPLASNDWVDSPERPNIIFLLTDDQRNDTLGCAGHPIVQTPNIDSLASEGVRFENCFVTTSICAASRASIFTSLHERTHGYTFGKPAVAEAYTLSSYPALLRQAGYRSGFIGKFGCSMKGSGEMFDYFETVPGPGYLDQPDGSKLESTEVMSNLAQKFIKDNDDRPFCLSVSFHASHARDRNKTPGKGHYPYPEWTSELYDDVSVPSPGLSDPIYFEILPEFLQTSMNRKRFYWRWDTPEKYQTNMRSYFRMISGIDKVVGQLRHLLKELNIEDDTIIIYSADNGYYMGYRGFAGKWTHFEQSLRVPLVIYDPRMPDKFTGQSVDPMVLNLDFAPTILELGRVEVPEHYQGRSLLSAMSGASSIDLEKRDSIFCEHLMDHKDIPKWEGVRTKQYKYARYFEQNPAYECLYDLNVDPTELHNLVLHPDYQTILKQMRSKTDDFVKQYEIKGVVPQNVKPE
ncbi:Arylsulfatase [Anaerohalosphaera lusitana]|uniref:Arylsulfatase n=1 Tax=Anaerohalosphaera lusitana TaxID=1936003 RepID=A0A1U9NJI7_9BACT|nr:sulfatase [Anaerohalosphaera lusitana]AQT68089.1 Arylsulfatase [Anaerohalosphaera lusitana]